jgi:dihydropteroate synthase
MGVLNITPDSFSDGGFYNDPQAAYAQAQLMHFQGAEIIDVGAESTKPGAERIEAFVEHQRLLPVLIELAEVVDLSVDTMNASTAEIALSMGAMYINDVSGGLADQDMHKVMANSNAHYILSHWRGHSKDMYREADYQNVASEVVSEIKKQVDRAVSAGVNPEKIIVDPGLGFNKDMGQNWELVARLDQLKTLGLPILVGHSRKKFLASALDPEFTEMDNSRRDLATAVLTALLMQHQLWGIRVHNVQASMDAINLVEQLGKFE